MVNYFFHLASTEFAFETQELMNKSQISIIDIILFDEKLMESSKLFRTCIQKKKDLLAFISTDYINLIVLMQLAIIINSLREILLKRLE